MRVIVELYAAARQHAGESELALEFAASEAGSLTLADVRGALVDRFPQLEQLIANSRLALNATFRDDSVRVGADDRVALILPVSGG